MFTLSLILLNENEVKTIIDHVNCILAHRIVNARSYSVWIKNIIIHTPDKQNDVMYIHVVVTLINALVEYNYFN